MRERKKKKMFFSFFLFSHNLSELSLIQKLKCHFKLPEKVESLFIFCLIFKTKLEEKMNIFNKKLNKNFIFKASFK